MPRRASIILGRAIAYYSLTNFVFIDSDSTVTPSKGVPDNKLCWEKFLTRFFLLSGPTVRSNSTARVSKRRITQPTACLRALYF